MISPTNSPNDLGLSVVAALSRPRKAVRSPPTLAGAQGRVRPAARRHGFGRPGQSRSPPPTNDAGGRRGQERPARCGTRSTRGSRPRTRATADAGGPGRTGSRRPRIGAKPPRQATGEQPAPTARARNTPGRCRANERTSSSTLPGSRSSSQPATCWALSAACRARSTRDPPRRRPAPWPRIGRPNRAGPPRPAAAVGRPDRTTPSGPDPATA